MLVDMPAHRATDPDSVAARARADAVHPLQRDTMSEWGALDTADRSASLLGTAAIDLSAFTDQATRPLLEPNRGYRRAAFTCFDLMANPVCTVQLVLKLSCMGQSLYRHITPTLHPPDPMTTTESDVKDAETKTGGSAGLRQIIPTTATVGQKETDASGQPVVGSADHPNSAIAGSTYRTTVHGSQPAQEPFVDVELLRRAVLAKEAGGGGGSGGAMGSPKRPGAVGVGSPVRGGGGHSDSKHGGSVSIAVPGTASKSPVRRYSPKKAHHSGILNGGTGTNGGAFPPIPAHLFRPVPQSATADTATADASDSDPFSTRGQVYSIGGHTILPEAANRGDEQPPPLFYYHQTAETAGGSGDPALGYGGDEFDAVPFEYQRTANDLDADGQSAQTEPETDAPFTPSATAAAAKNGSTRGAGNAVSASPSFFAHPAIQRRLEQLQLADSTGTADPTGLNVTARSGDDNELPLIQRQLAAFMDEMAADATAQYLPTSPAAPRSTTNSARNSFDLFTRGGRPPSAVRHGSSTPTSRSVRSSRQSAPPSVRSSAVRNSNSSKPAAASAGGAASPRVVLRASVDNGANNRYALAAAPTTGHSVVSHPVVRKSTPTTASSKNASPSASIESLHRGLSVQRTPVHVPVLQQQPRSSTKHQQRRK